MGRAKKTRKFAQTKRVISKRDARLKENKVKVLEVIAKKKKADITEVPQMPSNLFFQANSALVPPYQILVDTNFFSHAIRAKTPVLETAMDCLLASVKILVTDCVMAELEKLGTLYRLALKTARDERFTRLTCDHKGTYADDCIVDRIQKHRIYIVATNDVDLKRRVRKVPGVPIMSVAKSKFVIERLPWAPE